MRTNELILVINPGSTSTKVALYDGEREINSLNLEHSAEELAKYDSINDQLGFRTEAVMKYLKDNGCEPSDLAAIAARGGSVGWISSGAYIVDEAFAEASFNTLAPHPANLSPIIGYRIAEVAGTGIHAYVYDAVCGCGRPEQLYVVSGMPEIERPFQTHVLNSRAVAIEQARRDGVDIRDTTYIVCHFGGGSSVNLLVGGSIVDITGDDEGGFSPERSGRVPCRPLIRMCFSGRYTEKEMQKKIKGGGGLLAYLGTNDLREVERRIDEGDEYAEMIYEAFALQQAKDVGALATVVSGKVDKIIITGGIAHSQRFTKLVSDRVSFIAPAVIIPGAYEMEALAGGVLRVLRGEEPYHTFTSADAY